MRKNLHETRRDSAVSGIWRSFLSRVVKEAGIPTARYVAHSCGYITTCTANRVKRTGAANSTTIARMLLGAHKGKERDAAEDLYKMLSRVRTAMPDVDKQTPSEYGRDVGRKAIRSLFMDVMRRDYITARDLSFRSGVELKIVCAIVQGEIVPTGEIFVPLLAALFPSPMDLDAFMASMKMWAWRDLADDDDGEPYDG